MADFGGRAIPGISFRMGSSHSDLSQMKNDLQGIKDMLQQVQAEGAKTAASLNAVAAKRSSAGAAAKAPIDAAYQEVIAGRRAAQRQETVRRASDPLEQQYAQHVATQRTARMQAALTPKSDTERQYQEIVNRDRQQRMEETIKRGTTKDTSFLARGMNALSWSPFMPQSMYMAQMAMGDMGLGLSMPLMAAGLGIAGLGAAGLGLNAFAVNQARTGEQIVASTGSAPPFTANTYDTAAQESQRLTQREGALHLTGEQGTQAVSALAAGGLTSEKAFGTALDQTAVLVNAFGMSVSDAASFVAVSQTDMRQNTDQTTQALASLAKVSQATGIPLAALGQIVAQTPNMLADLSANPRQYGPAAAVVRAIGGTTQGSNTVGSAIYASGGQALALAARMGVSDETLNRMQQSATGTQQIGDFYVNQVKSYMATSSPDVALLRAQALIPGLDKATMERMGSLPANATTAAITAAMGPTGPAAPGSAASLLQQIASGNLAGASNTANPWNVKDMAVNATQVFLTGAVSQVGNTAEVIGNSSNMGTAQLQALVAQGGVAGAAARVALLARGQPTTSAAATSILNGPQIPGSISALGTPPTANAGQPAPGGGGSNPNQTVTINLQLNGQQLKQIPVSIGPNAQYDQYVPTTAKGPQYR